MTKATAVTVCLRRRRALLCNIFISVLAQAPGFSRAFLIYPALVGVAVVRGDRAKRGAGQPLPGGRSGDRLAACAATGSCRQPRQSEAARSARRAAGRKSWRPCCRRSGHASSERHGADTAEHGRRHRGRLPARHHGTRDAGDRRGHQPADHAGPGHPDHHRRRQGCGRRDRRRCARRARHLLDAWLQRRPAHHALQRHPDRAVDHDRPSHGRGWPAAGRDHQGTGLAGGGPRRDRRRRQLRDQGAAHGTDRQRGLHLLQFLQRLSRRLRIGRQHAGRRPRLPLRHQPFQRQGLYRRHLFEAQQCLGPVELSRQRQPEDLGRGRVQAGQRPLLLGNAAGAGERAGHRADVRHRVRASGATIISAAARRSRSPSTRAR